MVYKAIHYDHAPKSIKKLLDFRNTRYDLRGTNVFKTAEGKYHNLWTEIVALPSTKAVEPAIGVSQNFPHSLQNSIKKIDLSGLLS